MSLPEPLISDQLKKPSVFGRIVGYTFGKRVHISHSRSTPPATPQNPHLENMTVGREASSTHARTPYKFWAESQHEPKEVKHIQQNPAEESLNSSRVRARDALAASLLEDVTLICDHLTQPRADPISERLLKISARCERAKALSSAPLPPLHPLSTLNTSQPIPTVPSTIPFPLPQHSDRTTLTSSLSSRMDHISENGAGDASTWPASPFLAALSPVRPTRMP